jgi:hypothetical protein
MENEAEQEVVVEQKPAQKERVDELDIIGGVVVNSIKKSFLWVKDHFIPRK